MPKSDSSGDEYTPDENPSHSNEDPYPGSEKKAEILQYWTLRNGKNRSFASMKSRYTKLTTERQLRKWRSQLQKNGKFFSF